MSLSYHDSGEDSDGSSESQSDRRKPLPGASCQEIPTKRKFLEETLTAPNKKQIIKQTANAAPIKPPAEKGLDTASKTQDNRVSSTTRPNKTDIQSDKTHLRGATCLLDLKPNTATPDKSCKRQSVGNRSCCSSSPDRSCRTRKRQPEIQTRREPLLQSVPGDCSSYRFSEPRRNIPQSEKRCICSTQRYNTNCKLLAIISEALFEFRGLLPHEERHRLGKDLATRPQATKQFVERIARIAMPYTRQLNYFTVPDKFCTQIALSSDN